MCGVLYFESQGVAALREQMELERTEWSMEFNRLLFERQLQSDETAELKNGLQRLKSHCSHVRALVLLLCLTVSM
jgi:hypothetical protein